MRPAPDAARGILLGFQSDEVCGETYGRPILQDSLQHACGWIGMREIKILSILLAGSLKPVQVRVPLGLHWRE